MYMIETVNKSPLGLGLVVVHAHDVCKPSELSYTPHGSLI